MKRPKIGIAEQMYAAGIWERPPRFDGTSDECPMIDWSQEDALQAFYDLVARERPKYRKCNILGELTAKDFSPHDVEELKAKDRAEAMRKRLDG
jgi:hypothetical protein